MEEAAVEATSDDGAARSLAGGAAADIHLERIVKRFGDTVAVDGISLTIERGAFFALLGPSGCGKTTTLRLIGGFEDPTEGTIRLGGDDVTELPPYRRDVNTVFQSYALFPHLDVGRNVAFGLERRKLAKDEVRTRVGEALELAQLTGFERRKPAELSGGQQQRVALARALVNRPRALLLDEPLGALDLRLRKQLQLELKRIQEEVGITFVHVTHDQEEAMTMADEIAVMSAGRIEQRGSASDLYERPATEFVAGFLGVSNLIEGRLGARDGRLAEFVTSDGARLRVPAEQLNGSAPGAVRAGVRPEKIALSVDSAGEAPASAPASSEANSLRGRVSVASYLGVSTQYVVRTPGGEELTVIAQNNGGPELETIGPGRDVVLSWDPRHTFIVAKEEAHD
jgi:spermidine/putrescine transport system ATP-binding protein